MLINPSQVLVAISSRRRFQPTVRPSPTKCSDLTQPAPRPSPNQRLPGSTAARGRAAGTGGPRGRCSATLIRRPGSRHSAATRGHGGGPWGTMGPARTATGAARAWVPYSRPVRGRLVDRGAPMTRVCFWKFGRSATRALRLNGMGAIRSSAEGGQIKARRAAIIAPSCLACRPEAAARRTPGRWRRSAPPGGRWWVGRSIDRWRAGRAFLTGRTAAVLTAGHKAEPFCTALFVNKRGRGGVVRRLW